MKQCDSCIYGNKSEYEKPCIVYKGENCEMYKKRGEYMENKEALSLIASYLNQGYAHNVNEFREALITASKALENMSHIADRPCDVCEFHGENGCTQWKCVFCDELFGGMRR